jgi:hypothetical protein
MIGVPKGLLQRYLYGSTPEPEEEPLMDPAISDEDLQSDMSEVPVDPAADIRRRYLAAQEQGQREESLANIGAFMDNVNANFMRARGINASPAGLPRADRDAPARALERQLRMEAEARKVATPAVAKPGAPQKSRDPESRESLLARERVRANMPGFYTEEALSKVTEESEERMMKYGNQGRQAEIIREGHVATKLRTDADRTQGASQFAQSMGFKWAELSSEQKLRMQEFTDKQNEREAARAERKEETTQREALELSKRLENMPSIANDLGVLTQYAKAPDVPGVGATGAVPGKMLTEEGVRVRQAVRGVVGTLLKEQSGAAVQEAEITRKLEELGMGPYASDREFRLGLQRLLTNTDAAMRAKEAGASPEAVKRFRSRGGTTATDLPVPTPRTINTKGMKPGDLVKSLQEGETVRVPMGDGTYRTVRRKNGQLVRVKE